jgi:hypothetical protein
VAIVILRVLVVVGLLLVPVASAGHELVAGDNVITWQVHIHSANSIADWAGTVVDVNVTRPHSKPVVDTIAHVYITMNVGIAGSGVNRVFHIDKDGERMVNCSTMISTSGSVSQRNSFGGSAICPLVDGDGNFDFEIGAEQEWVFTNTGGGTVEYLFASVYLIIEETVEEPNMLLEFVQVFGAAMAMVVFGIMAGSRRENLITAGILMVFSVVAGIAAVVGIGEEYEFLRVFFIAYMLYVVVSFMLSALVEGRDI